MQIILSRLSVLNINNAHFFIPFICTKYKQCTFLYPVYLYKYKTMPICLSRLSVLNINNADLIISFICTKYKTMHIISFTRASVYWETLKNSTDLSSNDQNWRNALINLYQRIKSICSICSFQQMNKSSSLIKHTQRMKYLISIIITGHLYCAINMQSKLGGPGRQNACYANSEAHIGKTHDQHLEACCRGISSC